jgi:hypothetical protein
LFIHLLERDTVHCLAEIARVLNPRAQAAAGFETAERIGLVYGQVVHRLRRSAA